MNSNQTVKGPHLQFTLVESHGLLPVICLHSPCLRIVVKDKTFEKVPSM